MDHVFDYPSACLSSPRRFSAMRDDVPEIMVNADVQTVIPQQTLDAFLQGHTILR
jgi:hypothetical protein